MQDEDGFGSALVRPQSASSPARLELPPVRPGVRADPVAQASAVGGQLTKYSRLWRRHLLAVSLFGNLAFTLNTLCRVNQSAVEMMPPWRRSLFDFTRISVPTPA